MFRAIKRVFIWMGLMAEKATETDAINQAERAVLDAGVILFNKSFTEIGETFFSEQEIDISRGASIAMCVDGHTAYDRVGNTDPLQSPRCSAHGLMYRIFALEEHVNVSQPLRETERPGC